MLSVGQSVIIGSSVIKIRLFEKFEEIGAEIQQNYQSDKSVHVKRLAKEPGALPEAKKSLNFGDKSIETRGYSQYSQVQDVSPAIFPPALRPGIIFKSFTTMSVFAFGAVRPITGIQNSWIFSLLNAIYG